MYPQPVAGRLIGMDGDDEYLLRGRVYAQTPMAPDRSRQTYAELVGGPLDGLLLTSPAGRKTRSTPVSPSRFAGGAGLVDVAVQGVAFVVGELPVAQRRHDASGGRDEPLACGDQVQELQGVVDAPHCRLERGGSAGELLFVGLADLVISNSS